MKLAEYYLGDPRVVLVPIEHLSRAGMSAEFAVLMAERCTWSPARIDFFNAAFSLYWERTRELAHSRAWAAPRIRNVAILGEFDAVRPYVQLLNTSAWTVFEADFDPETSHVEFAAYLLVYGDRLAETGEVTMAALRDAAYWFDRTDEECGAFAAAAAESARPDASAFRALAKATRWLRQLYHETLKRPVIVGGYRSIPGTGLLVPRNLEEEPPKLVERWTKAAERALKTYHVRWHAPDAAAIDALCGWLSDEAPPLLVTDRRRILWDPEQPDVLGKVRNVLKQTTGVAVRAIDADLRVVDRHTRRFLAAVADQSAFPAPPDDTEQRGYAFLHAERRLIAYDVKEPGMERLGGPDLPYARAMLGARTMHEWAHLAAAAGWVPRTIDDARFEELTEEFAALMESTIAATPTRTRGPAEADLRAIASGKPFGRAVAELLLTRVSDYQSNIVAWRFLSEAECETYVRHNVRTLRPYYSPQQLWRMLIRYLYEYQYLGLSAVEDKRSYFFKSTWFEIDFIASNVLDEERFDALAAATHALCTCYAIDDTRIRLPT